MATFVRLTESGTVPPETNLLKARDTVAWEDAQQIVEAARQKEAEILEEAQKKYEAEKARGYNEGQEEAKIEFAEQIMDTVANTVEYFSQVEGQVADVVMAALRKILGEMDRDEVVLKAVRNALAVVRDQPDITLLVAPEQLEGVKSKMTGVLRGSDSVGHLEVVADQQLNPGECRLETELGVVDVSIDMQLESLEKAFRSRLGQHAD